MLNCFFSCKDQASERDRPYWRKKMYKKEKKVQSCHLRSQASLESPPLRVQNRTFPTKNGYQTIEQFNMSLGVQYHQAEKNVYIYIQQKFQNQMNPLFTCGIFDFRFHHFSRFQMAGDGNSQFCSNDPKTNLTIALQLQKA